MCLSPLTDSRQAVEQQKKETKKTNKKQKTRFLGNDTLHASFLTYLLGNEWWNIDKKLSAVHFWNIDEKVEKNSNTGTIAKLFIPHANTKTKVIPKLYISL